ncbi:ribonuclease III [Rhodoblastus acidophilus]|uniref:Ribonuclease 3 n=1 Tax=Candidatus Rhodoblastus alkanivorans TaxID=2954117 RepID=A0ABS9Z627_9HYPH|nr:ribonuclease III [Candidatus Rhodoblastus alkanivorans]MCI4678643.1 ribonuclease III [Candidatus Rhodoblastus alkanivorans]MCI4683052.1 ribonuclease III [Candidatus Rhodoblastus alkanivorans]MDI4640363.1 ribonuclease III [Rhodoblastus acidophilus]
MKPRPAQGLDSDALAALQERVGHRFGDPALLTRALTHVSALPAAQAQRRVESYQRLEFLGDRVLGLAVSEMLFEQFPEAEEGELSRRLADLVRKETCADVARGWSVGEVVRLGDGEAQTGGAAKAAILGDVCESILGAIFLDGGFAAARATVRRFFHDKMLNPVRPLRDPKTALQEWAQARGLPPPSYRQSGRIGPDHAPVFIIEVAVAGFEPVGAQGSSKRFAEQASAQKFLTREGVWEEGA